MSAELSLFNLQLRKQQKYSGKNKLIYFFGMTGGDQMIYLTICRVLHSEGESRCSIQEIIAVLIRFGSQKNRAP